MVERNSIAQSAIGALMLGSSLGQLLAPLRSWRRLGADRPRAKAKLSNVKRRAKAQAGRKAAQINKRRRG